MYEAKVAALAKARAEKARVDARTRLLEDATEHYRKAIATERNRLLRAKAKRAREVSSASDSGDAGEELAPQPEILAIADVAPVSALDVGGDVAPALAQGVPLVPQQPAPNPEQWQPEGSTCEDLVCVCSYSI